MKKRHYYCFGIEAKGVKRAVIETERQLELGDQLEIKCAESEEKTKMTIIAEVEIIKEEPIAIVKDGELKFKIQEIDDEFNEPHMNG